MQTPKSNQHINNSNVNSDEHIYNEIIKTIVEFNTNPDNQRIKNYYREDNIWNILKKSRSEEAHSAFIAWLLSIKEKDDETISPLLSFLNLLMLKAGDGQFNESLRNSIINGNIHLDIHPAETEKSISSLTNSKIRYNDRLDVYILCDIKYKKYIKNSKDSEDSKFEQLEIIIENKVGSTENDAKSGEVINNPDQTESNYAGKYQTEKYYYALCTQEESDISSGIRNNPKIVQLFVYLTPDNQESKSNKYIKITYQELYDYVIKPFARRNDITDKQKMYVDDYIRILGSPLYINNEDGNKNSKEYLIMANTEEEEKLFVNFLKNNMPLIVKAADVLSTNDKGNTDNVETLVTIANSLSKKVGIYGTYEILHKQESIVQSDSWVKLVKTSLNYIVKKKLKTKEELNEVFSSKVKAGANIIIDQNAYDIFVINKGFNHNDNSADQRYRPLYKDQTTDYYYYREWGAGNIEKFFKFIEDLKIGIKVEKID